ncbi:MAG TPA: UdgX family uracil-DNA binding protein [Noviherbaspirillum sp.]|uniref:UdgX family uracil-DNA binding protein n=1 Tax=Noviherbaspirillum sp. TaxID=1926288 RepID=UPI002B46B64D|nr:UdgX family uracil-DNA binding protein [Noviherbaspirillum sp.]HJV86241.1 UdgX family uracil-DNA binding protein [Noviherbaspirillum sp.]
MTIPRQPIAHRAPPKRAPRTRAPHVAPGPVSLEEVREEAQDCQACPLWANATQTVFGEGPEHARIMLVGEQPGDQEDRSGHPFVGPAGRLLDRALQEAGIERDMVYVTNAVKHFKWEPRGKRRMHKKPGEGEIAACHQWLERELQLVAPALVVAMGATAARALLGRATPIEANRGHLSAFAGEMQILVTVHPSYLLRVPDDARASAYARFVQDLKLAAPFAERFSDRNGNA